jgi:hypothetical protein
VSREKAGAICIGYFYTVTDGLSPRNVAPEGWTAEHPTPLPRLSTRNARGPFSPPRKPLRTPARFQPAKCGRRLVPIHIKRSNPVTLLSRSGKVFDVRGRPVPAGAESFRA